MNIQLRAAFSTFAISMNTMPGTGRPIDSRNIVVAANRSTPGIPQPNMASTSAPSRAREGLCPSASNNHSPVWNRPSRTTPAIHACRHAARKMKPDSRSFPRPLRLGGEHDGGGAQPDSDEEQGSVGGGGDGEGGELAGARPPGHGGVHRHDGQDPEPADHHRGGQAERRPQVGAQVQSTTNRCDVERSAAKAAGESGCGPSGARVLSAPLEPGGSGLRGPGHEERST